MMIGHLSTSIVTWGVLLVSFGKHCEAQSVPTPSPTGACLPGASEAVALCLIDNNLDGEACIDCHFSYLDLITDDTTCEGLTELICDQIDACTSSCGPCGSYIEAYETCDWGSDTTCTVSCSSRPVAPAPSPSAPSLPTTPSPPTTTSECDTEVAAMVDCVATNGDDTACKACIGEFTPDTIESCEAAEFYTCGAMEACPECGSCEAEYAAITNCLNADDCDPVDCTSPTPSTPTTPTNPMAPPPTPAPTSVLTTSAPSSAPTPACDDENNDLVTCTSTSGDGSVSCSSCIDAYFPDESLSCEAADQLICSAMDACPQCGNCESELVALNNCFNQDSTCPITACTTSAPTAAPSLQLMTSGPVASPPSPFTAPVSSPTSGGAESTDPLEERCPSENDGFQDCIATDLSSTNAASCESCVKSALDGFTAIARQAVSCSEANEALCPGLEYCDCGTCADELQSYLECTVDVQTTGCELECDNVSSPLNQTSTSGAATTRRCRLATIGSGVAAGVVVAALGMV